MKKILMIVIGIGLLYGAELSAEPFLVCDPPATANYCTHYEIYQDGVLIAGNVLPEADGSVRYDAESIDPGEYVFTAKCCNTANDWGCSEMSNPTTSDQPLSPADGLRLVKQ